MAILTTFGRFHLTFWCQAKWCIRTVFGGKFAVQLHYWLSDWFSQLLLCQICAPFAECHLSIKGIEFCERKVARKCWWNRPDLFTKDGVVWIHCDLILSGISNQTFRVREGNVGRSGSVALKSINFLFVWNEQTFFVF